MLQTTAGPARDAKVAPAGHYRWVIIALIFVITTINYMDRNLLGVLKPTIQGDLHFSETEYGDIVFAFSMAYAAGYAGMGAFTDKVGIRIGLAVAAMIWCAASTAHGLVTSVAGFTVARIALGLGEGGNFPTCIKTVATWFPVRDRAFATGIFNSGSNVGGLLAPLIAAFVTAYWGWQAAFYVTGRRRLHLGRVLVRHVPGAGGAPESLSGRTRLHPQRPGGPAQEDPVGHAAANTREPGPISSAPC